MRSKKILLTVAMAVGSGFGSHALASDVDFLFVVDESGSMSGEHTFLQTFVPDLSTAFSLLPTPLTASFGLVGYGGPNSGDPRQHLVGGGNFGTDAQFVTAAGSLVTSGGTEDGYEAMMFALNNVQFTATQAKVVILVTDEDRDVTSTDTLATVQQALTAAGASWSSILDQSITSGQSTVAIGTDGTVSYIADGSGGFTTEAGYVFGGSDGNTTADYSDPTLAGGGCVADLNLLRQGGATATSFAAAFLNCIQVQVQQQVSGGDIAVLTRAAPVVSSSLAVVMGVSNQQLSAIGHRIHEMRTHASLPGIQVAGLGFIQNPLLSDVGSGIPTHPAAPLGGGASADGMIADHRLSGFLSGRVEGGDFDQSAGVTSFDYKVHGLTGGVDYRLTQDSIVGVSLSYHRTDTNLANSAGGIDVDHYGLGMYASKTWPSQYYVDGTVSYTLSDLSTVRNVVGGQANGKTDSHEWAASLNVGRDFKSKGLTFGPYIGARYTSTTVDPYRETGTLPVNVAQQEVEGWAMEAGGRVSKEIPTSSGVVVLGGNLTLIHKLDDDTRSVTTSVASGTSLTSTVAGTDRTYFRLGLDVKADIKKDTQLFARYDALLDHAQSEAQSLMVGVRMAF